MRPHTEAIKADVRRRMSPSNRQSVVQIARELGIHAITLFKWRKAWRLQGEVVPASEKEAESWSVADKSTRVLETAGLNATELGGTCRERGLYPEQVDRWRKAAQDANAQPLLRFASTNCYQERLSLGNTAMSPNKLLSCQGAGSPALSRSRRCGAGEPPCCRPGRAGRRGSPGRRGSSGRRIPSGP